MIEYQSNFIQGLKLTGAPIIHNSPGILFYTVFINNITLCTREICYLVLNVSSHPVMFEFILLFSLWPILQLNICLDYLWFVLWF